MFGKADAKFALALAVGTFLAWANFLIMGLTIQKMVGKDEKTAAMGMKLSQALRMFAILGIELLCLFVFSLNPIAMIVPLFFPRIGIALRPVFAKIMGDQQTEEDNEKDK